MALHFYTLNNCVVRIINNYGHVSFDIMFSQSYHLGEVIIGYSRKVSSHDVQGRAGPRWVAQMDGFLNLTTSRLEYFD